MGMYFGNQSYLIYIFKMSLHAGDVHALDVDLERVDAAPPPPVVLFRTAFRSTPSNLADAVAVALVDA